jgi:hypothetical protein
MLYSLLIVEQFITGLREAGPTTPEQEAGKKWLIEFCKKGGLSHIYHAFINLPRLCMMHNFC